MTYADFTLESALAAFGLTATARPLFPELSPVEPPAWVAAMVGRQLTRPYSTRNEKARSEFLIAPTLAAVDELSAGFVTLYSGQTLVVDPAAGLSGECDFLFGGDAGAVIFQAPLLTVVEAKRADIELGTGQAVAQMVAVRQYNERAGRPTAAVSGCVTTGEDWQFLRLDGTVVTFDTRKYFIRELGLVLAAFLSAIAQARGQ